MIWCQKWILCFYVYLRKISTYAPIYIYIFFNYKTLGWLWVMMSFSLLDGGHLTVLVAFHRCNLYGANIQSLYFCCSQFVILMFCLFKTHTSCMKYTQGLSTFLRILTNKITLFMAIRKIKCYKACKFYSPHIKVWFALEIKMYIFCYWKMRLSNNSSAMTFLKRTQMGTKVWWKH